MIPASDSVSERPANGFDVVTGTMGDVCVRIWGDLGLGWFGRLSSALARRGLSIQSAQAVRSAHDSWSGVVELLTQGATTDPYTLDYLALTREPARTNAAEFRCERARIERSSTGTLELRFTATDEIGLLSGLFESLQHLGLYPERLKVTTDGHRVDDALWLRGVAGNAPSPHVEEALRALMARLTRGAGG